MKYFQGSKDIPEKGKKHVKLCTCQQYSDTGNQSEKPSSIFYGAKIMNLCFQKINANLVKKQITKTYNTYDKRGLYVGVGRLGASLIGFFIFTQHIKR